MAKKEYIPKYEDVFKSPIASPQETETLTGEPKWDDVFPEEPSKKKEATESTSKVQGSASKESVGSVPKPDAIPLDITTGGVTQFKPDTFGAASTTKLSTPKADPKIIDAITKKQKPMAPVVFKRMAESQPTPKEAEVLSKVKQKYYTTEPTPEERLDNFYNDLDVFLSEVQSGSREVNEEDLQDKMQEIANSHALIYDKEKRAISQHPEIVKRYTDRIAQESPQSSQPYLDALGKKLAAAGKGLERIPIDLLAVTEKGTNALLKKAGINADGTVWQDLSEEQRGIQEYLSQAGSKYDQGITEALQSGDTRSAIGQTGLSIAESIPYILLPMGFGLAGKLRAGSALASTGKALDVYMRDSKSTDIPEAAKIINATTQGLSEYVLEMLGTGAVVNSVNKAIAKEGVQNAKEYFVREMQPVVLRGINKVSKGISPAITDGSTEYLTELFDMMAENAAHGTPIDPKRATDAFIVGTVASAAITVPVNLDMGKREYVKQILSKIPEELSVDTKAELLPLVIESDVLANQKKNTAKEFHAPIDKKIETVQGKIQKLVLDNEGIDLRTEQELKEAQGGKKPSVTPKQQSVTEEKVEVTPEVTQEEIPLHERYYQDSMTKKSPESVAKMPEFGGKKFSIATILPNGDISNVYVRNEGDSHKTYMSKEDVEAYEEGRLTLGQWDANKNTFNEFPAGVYRKESHTHLFNREFGRRVMDIAASKVNPPVQQIETFTGREQEQVSEQTPPSGIIQPQTTENIPEQVQTEQNIGEQTNAEGIRTETEALRSQEEMVEEEEGRLRLWDDSKNRAKNALESEETMEKAVRDNKSLLQDLKRLGLIKTDCV